MENSAYLPTSDLNLVFSSLIVDFFPVLVVVAYLLSTHCFYSIASELRVFATVSDVSTVNSMISGGIQHI